MILEERLWAKVDRRGPEECWSWQGSTTRGGYGQIGGSRNNVRYAIFVHRLAYELLVGPIPAGLELDHLCRNPRCVNPEHLEAVTHRENTLRGETITAQAAGQTHCKHGHEFTSENTKHARGKRHCRACMRERSTAASRRVREATRLARAALASGDA